MVYLHFFDYLCSINKADMKSIFLFIGLLLFVGCGQTFHSKELETADSLMTAYKVDSAKQLLSHQDTLKMSDADKYYYMLLWEELQYKEYNPIDLHKVKKFLTYFEQGGNLNKQIRASLCLANALWDDGREDSAVYYAKTAEHKARKANDTDMLMKAYNFLMYANGESGNNRTAIDYCKKLLETAQRVNNKHEIGYAYDMMALAYAKIGRRDSFLFYIEKTVPYIEYQPKAEQPYFYNNLASAYYYKGDAKMQEYYLRKGLQIQPLPLLYGNLANLYVNEGRLKDAEQLWGNALSTSSGKDLIAAMKFYAQWLKESGRMDEYGEINHKIIQLKDSMDKASQTERVKAVQDDFEKETEASEWTATIWTTAAVAVVLLTLLTSYYLLRRHKLQREIHRLGSQVKVNEELLQQHADQLQALRKKQGASQRKVKRLETKMADLRNHQDELLAKGKLHFEEIVQGGRTVTWKKDDFLCFVEYYGLEHSEFVTALNQQYDGISPSQKCFLVLLNMGKTDDEVSHIMNLTPSAMRMTRSRINKRRTT